MGILVRFASTGAGAVSGGLGGILGGLTSIQGAAGLAGAAIGGFAAAGIAMNAKLETTTLQFKTLIGNMEEAQKHVAELFEFAKNTPFETQPIIDASIKLRVMGGAALDTKETMTLLGDAAAATNAPLDELAGWTGRMYAALQAGKPFGEAAQRLFELSVLTPQARTRMEEMQAAGASANEIYKVFTDSLGKFNGSMKDQAQTMSGQMTTAMDNLSMTAAEVMVPAFEALKDALQQVNAALSSEEGKQAIKDAADGLRTLMSIVGFLVTAFKDGILPSVSIVIEVWKDMAATAMSLSRAIQDFIGDAIAAVTGFGDVAEAVLEGDFKAAVANAKQLSYDMRNGMFDDHEVIQAATEETGDSIQRMAKLGADSMGDMGEASQDMALTMEESMQQVADSNKLLTEVLKERDRLLLEGREAAYEAGQALAEAASQDHFERIASDAEVEREIRDKQYEADGKALIKANEDHAKAQEKANNEALALQEKADKEALALQEKADKEAQRVQERAAEEQQRIAEKNAEVMERFSIELGQVLTQDLKRNLDEGVLSTDYATKQINEMLGTVPESVRDNITVFKDFTISLQDVAPEWQGALTPFMELVNSLPEETRKALGLDIFEWDFWAEAVKNTQSEALTAVQQAQKAIRDALAWKEETNARLGAPAGGRGIGLAGSGNVVGPVPSDSPLRSGAPLAPFNPMARYTQGTTVHGDIIVNARGSAAEEINALSALVR